MDGKNIQDTVKVKTGLTKRAGDSATPPEFIGGWRKTPSA